MPVLTGSESEVALPEPEPSPGPAPSPGRASSRNRRSELREQNSARVRRLVHRTRKDHADVNAKLSRAVGIRRITEATVTQLEKRLVVADRGLAKIP